MDKKSCHTISYTKDATVTSPECKCTVCACGNPLPYLDPMSEEFAERLTEAFRNGVAEALKGKPIC